MVATLDKIIIYVVVPEHHSRWIFFGSSLICYFEIR